MGTVKRLAEEVERGLDEIHPKLRKTVRGKLAVGAMIEGRTPNTVELANLLPLETERQGLCCVVFQWPGPALAWAELEAVWQKQIR